MNDRPVAVEKVCAVCKEMKPAAAFAKNKRMASGLDSYCRPCSNKKSKEAKLRARETNPKPSRDLLTLVRSRCRRQGIYFNITVEDLAVPEFCPALGIPLIYNPQVHSRPDSSPSVDRIDPSKGYVKGNVRIISFRANRIKSDATLAELKSLLDYVIRFKPTNLPPLAEGVVGHVPRKKATKQ